MTIPIAVVQQKCCALHGTQAGDGILNIDLLVHVNLHVMQQRSIEIVLVIELLAARPRLGNVEARVRRHAVKPRAKCGAPIVADTARRETEEHFLDRVVCVVRPEHPIRNPSHEGRMLQIQSLQLLRLLRFHGRHGLRGHVTPPRIQAVVQIRRARPAMREQKSLIFFA